MFFLFWFLIKCRKESSIFVLLSTSLYIVAILKLFALVIFLSFALCLAIFRFQGKPFNITVIQVYAPTSNAEEAEVERFYEDLQDLLELTPSLRPYHPECARSRLISEAKQGWAWLVLGWEN